MLNRLRYIRLSGTQRVMVWLGLLLLTAAAAGLVVMIHMRPILTGMATARVSNMVNQIVAAAVDETMRQGDISYGSMITLEKDDQGRVTALHSNMTELNRLQTAIADEILERLSETPTSDLSIPVGTLSGISLLAGRGPGVSVRMQTVGAAECRFRNAFMAAGINQTKHQVLLDVDVSMSILLPGFRTSTKVSNEIEVAETVIVGTVPETYTHFDASERAMGEYAEDYIMNNG